MKLKSIIALIISAALILSGIIVCVVASTMADSADIMLFPAEDDDGNLVYRRNLTDVSKLTIDSADANITIIGDAKESSIEIINFNANYYKLSESNGSLVFGQVDDFLSMFKFWDNGFSFKGMRYILRYGDDAAGKKKIIVRLAKESDVDLVHISTEKGNVSIENCALTAAYTVRSSSGKITLKNITCATSMNISGSSPQVLLDECVTDKLVLGADSLDAEIRNTSATTTKVITEEGNTVFKDCTVPTFTADMAEGDLTVSPCTIKEGTFSATSGKLTLDLESVDSLASIVSTKTGKISVNGEFVDGFSKNSPEPEHSLTVNTENGDVFITYPTTEE